MEHPAYHLFLTSLQPVSILFTTLPSVLVAGSRMISEKAFAVKGKNDCLKYESRALARLFSLPGRNHFVLRQCLTSRIPPIAFSLTAWLFLMFVWCG